MVEEKEIKEALSRAATEGEKKDMTTCFEDANNFTVKHPLFHQWTLWFEDGKKKAASKDWGDAIKDIITFDSVEEFWGIWSNIAPASRLPLNSSYYLFKKGIQPAWEDPANEHGGNWRIQLGRNSNITSIDNLWLYTALAAIGETLDTTEDGEELTGIALTVRKVFFRVDIWTRTSNDRAKTESIGKKFQQDVLAAVGAVNTSFSAPGAAGAKSIGIEFTSFAGQSKKGSAEKWVI